MPSLLLKACGALALFAVLPALSIADEPAIAEIATDPGANRADEPLAKRFSLDATAAFLDASAVHWTRTRGCFTCHTNYAYLYARPALSADTATHREIRQAAEDLVTKRWSEKKPRWDAEVIATAAALAFNDSATTGKLHSVTRSALDRMWTVQRKDGGFTWIKCKWPPMEIDDHYGVTLAAIAVGVAPDGYAQTEAAQKGLEGIRRWLRSAPVPSLHHRAMLLWAATTVDGILTADEQKQCVADLLAAQKSDGGWNHVGLGNWSRGDDKPADLASSDGYATGFVIYVLRKAGVPATDPRLQKGVVWLKSNQRESGRWWTRSAFKDNRHFITHAGTAFAVMALKECGQIDTASR